MKKELYKCNKCGKVVLRDPMIGGDGVIRKTPRVWRKTYCETLGIDARFYRVKRSCGGVKRNWKKR